MRETNGAAEDVTDDEIRDVHPAAGRDRRHFCRDRRRRDRGRGEKTHCVRQNSEAIASAVICVTGNGLKTLDAVQHHCGKAREIKPSLREFEALLAQEESVRA